jgi:tripartite-type tricarboxylate transporter receptor subunit TctC
MATRNSKTPEAKMAGTTDITNLTDAGLDTLLAVAAGEDVTLPAGLSNADLDAISAELVRKGADPDFAARWALDYRRQNPGTKPAGAYYNAAEAAAEARCLADWQ